MRVIACSAQNKGRFSFTRQQSCDMIPVCYMGVVMLSKVVFAAILALSSGLSMAQAQSLAQIGGPAELPPSSFDGQQYVDSRGCVFLRAGVGGRTTWAPRLDRGRKVLCGYPPTFGARPAAVAEVAPEPTPAPVPTPIARTAAAPLETVASAIPRTAPAPAAPVRVAVAPPVVVAQAPAVAATGGTTGRQIGCFTNTPVPVRVQLTNGGSAVLCTRGDGTLEGARAPIYPAGSGVGASLTEPQFAARNRSVDPARVTGTRAAAVAVPQVATAVPTTPPPGYRTVWEDDRLNPNRARGTAAGQAMQDQVWTRETPARLVSEVAAQTTTRGGVSVSTKTEPTAPVPQQAAGPLYVQVGTFGVPANAAGARDRLLALGLGTARSDIRQGGRALTIVLAGPFASAGEAQTALNAARGAGFGDAFIR
jgi:SPOR domain